MSEENSSSKNEVLPHPETEEEQETKKAWGMLLPCDENLPHVSLSEPEFTMGRSTRCTFRLSHTHISGVHLKISLQELKGISLVNVVDHSSNGTYLNEVKLEKGKRYILKHMDVISLVHPRSKKWSFTFMDLSFTERSEHSTIQEKYQLYENIGEGTFSVVKRGVCIETGEPVAVKVIDKSRFYHIAKTKEQISREVSILQQIKHPNIISILDCIDTERWLYIILEMATGGDLFRSLESQTQFSERDAHRYFTQILHALKYLHNEKHTAHRDLKPENILLSDKTPNACVKLTDFGLARMVTQQGLMTTMCGTPEYVAPEILFGSKNVTGYGIEVDMWSAGVLLYILLSGTLAFHQQNKTLLYQSIRRGAFSFSPEERWVNVSQQAKDLIRKLIEVDPEKRYTVDQALNDVWVKNGPIENGPLLDIHSQLQETLSQPSISFNILDFFETVELENTSEDEVPQTPLQEGENEELTVNQPKEETTLLKKRSLPEQDPEDTPDAKKAKYE